MASVADVARYLLKQHGPMSAMKLQKLVYYCQAWNLVWHEAELFPEDFEAWANGPVCRALYDMHKGKFTVKMTDFAGSTGNLRLKEKKTADAVLEYYGQKTAQWLSDLTHLEEPWKQARGNSDASARSTSIISKAAMHEYYSGLSA